MKTFEVYVPARSCTVPVKADRFDVTTDGTVDFYNSDGLFAVFKDWSYIKEVYANGN